MYMNMCMYMYMYTRYLICSILHRYCNAASKNNKTCEGE